MSRFDRLKAEYKSFGDDVPEKNSDKYKEMYRISRIVSTVLDDMDIQSDSAQPEKKKESVLGKLEKNKEKVRQNEAEKSQNTHRGKSYTPER